MLRKSDGKRRPGGRPSNSSTTNSKSGGGPRCSNEGFNAAEGDATAAAVSGDSTAGATAGQSRPSLSKKVRVYLTLS